MIEQGVLNLLLGNPAASDPGRAAAQAAVFAAVGGRVFPGKAPQDAAYPYAVVVKAGAQHQKFLGGRAGLATTQVRLEVYHQLYATAEGLAEQCRLLLDGYRGALANGMSCQAIFQDDDSNNWQQPVHSDEQGVEAVTLNLKVVGNES